MDPFRLKDYGLSWRPRSTQLSTSSLSKRKLGTGHGQPIRQFVSHTYLNVSSGVQERVLSVLLNEMDGVGVRIDGGDSTKEKSTLSNSLGVMLIGATNRPDMLDPALCRYVSWLDHTIT